MNGFDERRYERDIVRNRKAVAAAMQGRTSVKLTRPYPTLHADYEDCALVEMDEIILEKGEYLLAKGFCTESLDRATPSILNEIIALIPPRS